jgi:predicted DNA-binding transcriptional regulator YafY
MNYFDYTDKLERIKQLAAHKQTGTPTQLAKRLNVSKRTAQRMIQQLRGHGCPVIFNRIRFTYEVKAK